MLIRYFHEHIERQVTQFAPLERKLGADRRYHRRSTRSNRSGNDYLPWGTRLERFVDETLN